MYQAIVLILVAMAGAFLWHNTLENLATRQIRSGFEFLHQQAGFDIGEGLLAYTPQDSYLRAFLAGVANTLRVALFGIVTATVLGIAIGIGRLARNPLLRAACGAYVETLRNIPLIIQLFAWYFALTVLLPAAQEALQLAPHVTLSKSGLQLPSPVWALGWSLGLGGLIAGLALLPWLRHKAVAQRMRSGTMPTWAPLIWLLPILLPLGGWLAGGAPTAWDIPELGPFSISGGMALTPEFLALYIGLSTYTASYIAEIVRAGIQAVSKGQVEAGNALGLTRGQQLRLVIFPQALRVMVPPLTSQFLNLTKNSSLAVAVGYPDIVSVANTAINQNGQALECVMVIMLVYLTTSLSTSVFMNWYNRKAMLVER